MKVDSWTKEQDALLTKLWNIGQTTAQIAVELRKEVRPYTSKDAVVGRVHRLKFTGRKSPILPPRPKVQIEPLIEKPILPESADTCRWLDDDKVFCDHQVKKGKSYCPFHCTIVYQPKPEITE